MVGPEQPPCQPFGGKHEEVARDHFGAECYACRPAQVPTHRERVREVGGKRGVNLVGRDMDADRPPLTVAQLSHSRCRRCANPSARVKDVDFLVLVFEH